MDTTPGTRPKPVYPLRSPRHDDAPFSVDLLGDICEVLVRHGYPPLAAGNDFLRLSNALFATIYREN